MHNDEKFCVSCLLSQEAINQKSKCEKKGKDEYSKKGQGRGYRRYSIENESFHHSGHFQVTRDIYTFTACLESGGSSASIWSIRGWS